MRNTAPAPSGTSGNGARTPETVNTHQLDLGKGPSAGSGRASNSGFSGRPAPKGSQQTQFKNGSALQKRPNGRVSDVRDARRGLEVHHGINGSKRVLVERPDHSGSSPSEGAQDMFNEGTYIMGTTMRGARTTTVGGPMTVTTAAIPTVVFTSRCMLPLATIRLDSTDGL